MELLQNHTGTMARNYDAFFGKTEEDLRFFREEAAGARVVVEFCVGTGRLALPLAEAGTRVVGVDRSADMLAICKAKADAAQTPVELHVGDMRSFDAGVRADLVICACRSFMHNLTPEGQLATLRNFARHLADDGKIIVSAWHFDAARIGAIRAQKEKRWPYRDDAGEEWEVVIRHHRVDEIEQTVEATFAHVRDGREVDANEVHFRWIHPAEFELLAALAGLRVAARYGDFQRTTFAGQENIVWVLTLRL